MSNQPASLLMAPAATVEVMSYIGGVDASNKLQIPHTFLHVTDVNGNAYDFGFAPAVPGSPLSPGQELKGSASHLISQHDIANVLARLGSVVLTH